MADALDRYLDQHGVDALPQYTAVRMLAAHLRTTLPKVRQWLNDASAAAPADGPSPIEQVQVSTHGNVFWALRANASGTVHAHQWSSLHTVGYSRSDYDVPHIDASGRSLPGDAWLRSVRGKDRVTLPDDDARFVTTAGRLRSMATQHEQAIDEKRLVNGIEEHVAKAYADEQHGEALAYLRGFLDTLPRSSRKPRADARAFNNDVTLTLDLFGDQIDALGEALRRAGVTPKPRSE
jgi:hypothetical protein